MSDAQAISNDDVARGKLKANIARLKAAPATKATSAAISRDAARLATLDK